MAADLNTPAGDEDGQIRLDQRCYELGREYLLSFDQVTPELLEAHLLPDEERAATLAGIYRRLLGSAASRTMGPNVIAGAIGGLDRLVVLLGDFDPRSVVEKYGGDSGRVLADVQTHLAPDKPLRDTKRSLWPLYCRTIVSGAAFLAQFDAADDFYRWVDRFDKDDRARAALPLLLEREIEGIGFALAADFIKELGYTGFAKPDVHLKYIFTALGLSRTGDDYAVFKAVARVAKSAGVTPYEVDKLFWLIGSGSFYKHGLKVPTSRVEFAQLAKERLGGTGSTGTGEQPGTPG